MTERLEKNRRKFSKGKHFPVEGKSRWETFLFPGKFSKGNTFPGKEILDDFPNFPLREILGKFSTFSLGRKMVPPKGGIYSVSLTGHRGKVRRA